MDIPACYDPVYQEERRQAAIDRRESHFPICSCCGARIYPSGQFYELDVRKYALIVCEECASEMMDNPCIVEDVRYGN